MLVETNSLSLRIGTVPNAPARDCVMERQSKHSLLFATTRLHSSQSSPDTLFSLISRMEVEERTSSDQILQLVNILSRLVVVH